MISEYWSGFFMGAVICGWIGAVIGVLACSICIVAGKKSTAHK